MKTSTALKWGVAAAAVVGLGLAAMGTASAAEDDEHAGDGLEGTGTRHGISYEGCDHFELVDPDAVEAWGRSNAWRFAKWIPKLDELRADPEPAIIEALEMLFPECTWPPPESTTFGPERLGWEAAMAAATQAVQSLDMAGTGGGDPQIMAGTAIGRVLAFGLRAQPIRRRRRG